MIESEYLKDTPRNVRKLTAIIPLKRLETENFGHLLRLSRIRKYEDGEVIIREGDTDPWVYFLLSGRVKVRKGKTDIGTIDKTGVIFGEMRILDGMPRSASVYAKGMTTCLVVDTVAARTRLTPDERTGMLLLLYRIFTENTSIRLLRVNNELINIQKKLRNVKRDA
ncbi:cyclic nucleotide-binding domain-containing protein [Desulfococcaceae bacterium HSG8]|nr:cyclic nucleotide-binding domain-containing protein [Desulfococcaceae bacterium HSG8]